LTQCAGAIAQEAAKSRDPGGVATVSPPLGITQSTPQNERRNHT